MIRGVDWFINVEGKIEMDYTKEKNWEPWKEKFCWWPTKIVLKAENPYDYPYHKYVWLKKIYVRRRNKAYYPDIDFEYEYAEDVFGLLK